MRREEATAAIAVVLVDFYRPEKVYLFGSTARGDGTDESDLDFMVLLSDDASASLLKPGAGPDLPAVGFGKDIVVWRASEFNRWLPLRTSFPATIAEEGKLLSERVLTAA